MPTRAQELVVKDYGDELTSPIAFSALPGEVAGEIEQRLAKAGHAVLSNSSTHRMEPDVPLVIAEVNPDHLCPGIQAQKKNRGWSGYIVTNGNCSAIPGPDAQAVTGRPRARCGHGHDHASRLRRRLPGRAFARHDR